MMELTVVLAILALVAALSFPRLMGLYNSVTIALERDDILEHIDNLTISAIVTGRRIVLSGSNSELGEASTMALHDSSGIKLPDGWVISVPRPIVYEVSGFCRGGQMVLRKGTASYSYILKPPRCNPKAVP